MRYHVHFLFRERWDAASIGWVGTAVGPQARCSPLMLRRPDARYYPSWGFGQSTCVVAGLHGKGVMILRPFLCRTNCGGGAPNQQSEMLILPPHLHTLEGEPLSLRASTLYGDDCVHLSLLCTCIPQQQALKASLYVLPCKVCFGAGC